MDYEPLTFVEKQIKDEVEKTFGDKDLGLKNIVLYTRLLELNPNDEELKLKLESITKRIRQMNEVVALNINNELKCSLDSNGQIVSLSNV
jgi:hypothetical protein